MALTCMKVACAASHVCDWIRSNEAFDGDRHRQSGGGPYDAGAMVSAIDLTCLG